MPSMNAPVLRMESSEQSLVAVLPGRWLLKHCTPSWRIQDFEKGFQRVVSEKRARLIAIEVLDQGRGFPNAIVLATDRSMPTEPGNDMEFPDSSRFLVVDGQHRLWSQNFSSFEADFPCIIHFGMNEKQMAELFLEINDNQKRVPSSLRWDLVRLVRPIDDPHSIAASELVWELATNKDSPLFQRIDLTGENNQIALKQGSLAPEIRNLVKRKDSPLNERDLDECYEALAELIEAVKLLDQDGWNSGLSVFYAARSLRALLSLMPRIVESLGGDVDALDARDYHGFLSRIDLGTLARDHVVAMQGSSGIKAIREVIASQLWE